MPTKTYKQVKRKIRKLNKNQKDNTDNDDLVIQEGNTFHVYNEYKIVKDTYKFNIYVNDSKQLVDTVFKSSSAIAWCNAHKGNDVALAENIIKTDRFIEHLTNDIAHTKMMIKLKSTPPQEQSILIARLTEYGWKQIRLKLNLHKYIQRAKQIKSKGFLNEYTGTSTTNKFKNVR